MEEKFGELLQILERLRGEQGCPWDRQQTRESVKPYLLEEAYEAVEAIERGDPGGIRDELGDVLLQVIFQAQIAKERGEFDAGGVVQSCIDKMVRRHPHVFGDQRVQDAREVLQRWEDLKRGERGDRPHDSLSDGIPVTLPALLQAKKVQERASRAGLDWPASQEGPLADRPGVQGALAKVSEEIEELRRSLIREDRQRSEEELGDLLFSVVNLARFIDADPDGALRGATRRFTRRFAEMERGAKQQGKALRDLSPEALERLWEQAKDRP